MYFPSASPCFIDISACIFKCTNKILKDCKLRSVWRLCWTAFLGTLPARKHQFTSVDVLMYILVCAPSQFVMNNITFYSFISYIYIHTYMYTYTHTYIWLNDSEILCLQIPYCQGVKINTKVSSVCKLNLLLLCTIILFSYFKHHSRSYFKQYSQRKHSVKK